MQNSKVRTASCQLCLRSFDQMRTRDEMQLKDRPGLLVDIAHDLRFASPHLHASYQDDSLVGVPALLPAAHDADVSEATSLREKNLK